MMHQARPARQADDRGEEPPRGAPMPDASTSAPGRRLGPPEADAPRSLREALSRGGMPLPAPARREAEADVGADLSHVSIHTGPAAARALDDADARAMTVGSAVFLRDGAALNDRRLLVHELAHVIQPPATPGARTFAEPGDPAEREAASRAAGDGTVAFRARTALVHREPRHPTATVFDADYLLYALPGTDYDSSDQHYYLSPWDRSHLRRVNGLYVIEARGTSLVTPPEVRRAAGGRGVLVELSASEVVMLFAAQRAGAAGFVTDLARRRLGVTVTSVTLSTGGDQDFTSSTLPPAVAAGLASPMLGVEPGQQAGVQAARQRAASTAQERTLTLAAARGEDLPMQELHWSDRMDVNTLFGRDDAGRAAWYVDRLAAFQAQLLESARGHAIPMQLLAAVILNELADIDWADVLQSGPNTFRGSLGIAQIQIDTARRDRLIDLPPGAHRGGFARAGIKAHDVDDPAMVDFGEKLRTGQLLQVPQVAIEAAAREIALLLTTMAAHRVSPWQMAHHFTATGPEGDGIYAHVGTGSQTNREAALAGAVCGAYNSPDVIIAADTSRYQNATIHGSNAEGLAEDLARFRLFHTS
jgi:hypothetical protein